MKRLAKLLFLLFQKFFPKTMESIYFSIKGAGTTLQKSEETTLHVQKKSTNIQNLNYYKRVFEKNRNPSTNLNKIDIAFIVPKPIEGSGGHRNFYRAIKYLYEFGHDMTVYYTQTTESTDDVKSQVSNWFYDMKDIPYICYDGKLGYHDIAVATWWETAYMLNENINKVKFGFYFVQDFEPAFNPISSTYILAENSYKLGLSHICSGKWCKDFLSEKYQAEAEFFQFPVDVETYNTNKPRTKINKNIIFFAKPEMLRRCYEIGIMALKELNRLNPDVEIILFGSNHVDKSQINFPVTVFGLVPTINDLADLYRNADLGLVFSTTNPSLVPYEMLSCGCPVADLNLEKSVSKYGDSNDNVFLCSPEPIKLAKELCSILDDSDTLSFKANKGMKWVHDVFPAEVEMARRIEAMIKKKINNGCIEL